jgi:hypothetical protein
LEIEWAGDRWGSGPPPSAMESQPGRRTGTRSKRDGTERSGIRVLGSPPISRRARTYRRRC